MTTFGVISLGQMLSVGEICFEDRCRKGETWGGGWMHRSGLQCIAAVAAACRKALDDAGWAICLQQEVKGAFFTLLKP